MISRESTRFLLRAAPLVALAAIVVGCVATLPADLRQNVISPEMLLRGEPLTGASDPAPLADADVLGLDDDMRRFVGQHVNARLSAGARLRQLLEAVFRDEGFVVEYDERTYTAAEAFRLRHANCLSFTNLFVALARYTGISVRYQEVDVPPDWTESGDTLILNRHINTFVATGDGQDRVVDFNIEDFRASYDRRQVTDARALAHYYSNVGVERLQAHDTVEALRNFRKAIEKDPSFAPAWINLGNLYLRADLDDWAVSSWLQALAIDPQEQVAVSNIERVYRKEGWLAEADELRAKLQHHRMENPYYRYYLAQEAFDSQDYKAAISHLKFAVRKKENEDQFFALLGLAYLRQGDRESAQRWIARAAEVADDEDLKRVYHSKLEMLKRTGAG